MGNLAGLAEESKTFLLIDGAKVKDLAQAIYREEANPRCDALYRGTELADLLEVSPWLVETHLNSALARKCFEEWKQLGAAIVLQADCPFEDVLDHLRGLLIARLATGEEVIFRFYDPEIARHLLKRDSSGKGVRRFMGPCSVFAIQDRRSGEWECLYNHQPSDESQQEVFTVHKEHQVAMERAAERTARSKLEIHTAKYFPHLLHHPDTTGQAWGVISDLVSQARGRGLYSTRDIALYINTIGWLGHHAFEDSDVQSLWRENSASPAKAIVRIAEFAQKKSKEGLAHG
ncbi:DUF4123 domain-containing protein [Marinobacter metalliresistant]|uniref:DUF4123 domain-containing protein n=1 Tax=Marinobacter metalliresistant TaxID=2961995 RepID=A0ABZ2VYS4_9GAMM